LIKYNSSGERQFVKDFASGEFSTSGGISETSLNMVSQADGTTLISGIYGGFGSYMVFGKKDTLPMPDFATEGFRHFIAAYDANGNYLDVASMIDAYLTQPNFEWMGNDMHVNSSGKLFLTGKYAGSLKMGSDTLFSFNQQDEMYIAQLDLASFLDVTTSVEEARSNSLVISVYPNPCSDHLHIKVSQESSFERMTVQIYDLQGRLLLKKNISGLNHQLDLQQLPAGRYVVWVNSQQERWVGKIQK